MKQIMLSLLVVCTLAVSANALNNNSSGGRPDPTSQGRYTEYGTEVLYPEAHVLNELPAGASCAPAGEMIGARVWNSTREGHVILSELSDKAQIATTAEGKIFLCKCARGYNQLFLPTPPTVVPSPEPPAIAPVAPAPPKVEERLVVPPLNFRQEILVTGQGPSAAGATLATAGAVGAVVGGAIAFYTCASIGLSALAGTGVGLAIAAPAWWVIYHHHRKMMAKQEVWAQRVQVP